MKKYGYIPMDKLDTSQPPNDKISKNDSYEKLMGSYFKLQSMINEYLNKNDNDSMMKELIYEKLKKKVKSGQC